ncbi:alpha/beta fold hydrolase [Solilutibacter silvestris]|uniref:alpha/beta fold hydrolase n=1 Tax=Solilutibacter silvestris TaxID=1645665 RepID=UPI003D344543
MRRLFRWILRGTLCVLALLSLYVAGSVLQVHLHERLDPTAAAPAGGRFTIVDGVSIHSRSHGREDAPALLLVPGTAAWGGAWFSLIPTLERAGYRIIAVDLPPFGYSDKAVGTDFSRPVQARRLAAVLDAYKIADVVVVGHSYGGGPALELALAQPQRVRKLVLVDAALGLGSHPDPESPVCRLLATTTPRHIVLSSTATNPLWSKALLDRLVARREAVTDEIVRQYRVPSDLRGATDALGAWGDHFLCDAEQGLSTNPADISRLQPPLALIWGERDTNTPLAQAQRLHGLLPHSSLRVIPGVGHIPHIEAPASFERSLLDALQEPAAK